MTFAERVKDMSLMDGVRDYAIEYSRENGQIEQATLSAGNKVELLEAWDGYLNADEEERASRAAENPDAVYEGDRDGIVDDGVSVNDAGPHDMAKDAMKDLKTDGEHLHLYDVEMEFEGISAQQFGKSSVFRIAAKDSASLTKAINTDLEDLMADYQETGEGLCDEEVLNHYSVKSVKQVDRENRFSLNLGYGDEDFRLEVLDGEDRAKAMREGSGFPLALVYADGPDEGKVAAMAVKPMRDETHGNMWMGVINPDIPGLEKTLEDCGVAYKSPCMTFSDGGKYMIHRFSDETLEDVMGVKGADTYQADWIAHMNRVKAEEKSGDMAAYKADASLGLSGSQKDEDNLGLGG